MRRPVLACASQEPLVEVEETANWFIGDEAQKRRETLNLQQPISRATVTNWDNMEKVGCSSCEGGPGTWGGMSRRHPVPPL